jgi:micrococcal nuclease
MRFFYQAKVAHVVDGDTVDLLIDLGFDLMPKVRIRLHGVNTPESRTRDLEEKELGLAAKDYVYDWLSANDYVYVRILKDGSGKHGRISGYIYADDKMTKCLNDDIIDSGHGQPYYGGKR